MEILIILAIGIIVSFFVVGFVGLLLPIDASKKAYRTVSILFNILLVLVCIVIIVVFTFSIYNKIS